MNNDENIPEINLKLESVIVKSNIRKIPFVIIDTPYILFSDKNGTQKVWIKSKRKIVLYYLYQITNIKWFLKKYNEK